MRIDSHQHFWRYTAAEYPWIQPEWSIRRSFLPEDLQPALQGSGMDACVAVQARQSIEETRWLLQLADEHPFIAGVVGWVDLRSPHVFTQLEEFRSHPQFVGVRHVVQDEPDDQFMLRPEFQNGIRQLKQFDLAYDILIYPRQLPAAVQLVRNFPGQRFVLDHLAKPLIRERLLEPWRAHIQELASQPNVMCKISGMVTEARWNAWDETDFQPFLDVAWEAFGEDRLMIGSDWPVCLNAAASYTEVMQLARNYLSRFSSATQEKVLGGNAVNFYKLRNVC